MGWFRGRVVLAAAGAAACVAFGAWGAVSSSAESVAEPKLDGKPTLERVIVDRRKGRDRVAVLARVDNPLHTRGVGITAPGGPMGATHRARVHIRLHQAGHVVASVRARQDLGFVSDSRDQPVVFVIKLPRGFDAKRERGGAPLTYSATVLHALDPEDSSAPNDRAKLQTKGQVSDGTPGNSPIHSFYANKDASISLTTARFSGRLYAEEIVAQTPACGATVGSWTGGQSTSAAIAPDFNNDGDPTSGLLIDTTGRSGGYQATISGDGSWGWVWYLIYDTSYSYSFGQAIAEGPTTAPVSISASGEHAKVSIGKFSWHAGQTGCSYGPTKATLSAMG